jgi:hypothetical protein
MRIPEGCSRVLSTRIDPHGNNDSLDIGSPPFNCFDTIQTYAYLESFQAFIARHRQLILPKINHPFERQVNQFAVS